jgi:hypothetical protein
MGISSRMAWGWSTVVVFGALLASGCARPGATSSVTAAPASAEVAAAAPAATPAAVAPSPVAAAAEPVAPPQPQSIPGWPLSEAGYGEYELGQRYSFLLSRLVSRKQPHEVGYDPSLSYKRLALPQQALGTTWELQLTFDREVEKIFSIALVKSSATEAAAATAASKAAAASGNAAATTLPPPMTAADCERLAGETLAKTTQAAGFRPTIQQAVAAQQGETHLWQYPSGVRLKLVRACSTAPYLLQLELHNAPQQGA